MEMVLGTYERYLVGYRLMRGRKGDEFKMKQSFTEEAHNGSIKCVATSDRYLVSGGTDESIRIFDLTTHQDVGTLMQQEGTITCLAFVDNDFLLSGSEDGTICVWDVKNWTCAKTLKGHKKALCSLSVHPTGGLALSISKDKSIRTWDLVKGRCAFVHNMKEIGNKIQWSPSKKHFVVTFDRRIDVYDITKAEPVQVIPYTKQIYASNFLNGRILAVGLDDGSLELLNVLKNKVLKAHKVHDNRIKEICVFSKGILTASSDGVVKLLRGKNLVPQAVAECGCRINCMTIFRVPKDKKTKSDKST